ncbi:transposase (plasmid) [Roseomonas marmotae]|uniref:Transposase n=1 Tax=Roseomonas marmotae TaxID=2768161 RepID=A0ABS3KI71_9PROT|nr:transposase [Roseomonas marmotae]QTI81104.1 transposase [Roseomonas marmotae]
MACRCTARWRSSAAAGWGLDRSTLCDWVGAACWWLRPLYERVLEHIRKQGRVFCR